MAISKIESDVYKFRRKKNSILVWSCIFILWVIFVILISFLTCLVNVAFMPEEYHLIEVGENKNSKLHFLSTFVKEVEFAKKQLERIGYGIFCIIAACFTPFLSTIWKFMCFCKTFKKYPRK